ncbi:MAG: flavin reductase family protein [Pararhodobacter sp.]
MTFARMPRMSDHDPIQTFAPGPGDERRLRDALGAFATGVTVVTTRTARGPVAMTANSFASVSLAPPLVLWSPARASRRFAAFAEADHFAIHILAADQAPLVAHFARHGGDFALPGLTETAEGVPILPGCLAVFDCARHAVHEGGDHAIVVGRVRSVRHRPGAPLVFQAGRYGGFAPDRR